MSSSTNKAPNKLSAVYIRDDEVVVATTKLSKTIIDTNTSLSTYKSKNPLNQHMIHLVQHMYKSRDMTNFKAAKTALDLLTSKKGVNKFQTRFTNITKLINKKQIKLNLKETFNDSIILQ